MTERFRLAANVLLKRRLNNLVRIDNNVEIDRDFITCAEYQLFIDDLRQSGKNLQPDHWKSEKFPSGDAKKPITGVRSSDAEEFCEWLTNKEGLSGFNYRLPNLIETKEILPSRQDLGCWCQDNDTFIISGITVQQWQIWQQTLSDYIIFRENFLFYLNRDLYLYLYEEIKSDLASNLLLMYFLLIFPIILYQSLSMIYGKATSDRKVRQKFNLSREECEQKSREYAQKKDEIFQLYAYLVLIDLRQKDKMPAWEGIRIVRERKELEGY